MAEVIGGAERAFSAITMTPLKCNASWRSDFLRAL
jgi:hypothetical protein